MQSPVPYLVPTCNRHPDKAPEPSPEDEDMGPSVTFGSLLDQLGRYESFKKNTIYRGYKMDVPPVFTDDGNIVLPSDYKTAIPNDTVVAIRGSMKM